MQAVLMMTSETARADGVADEATIDARGLPYRALNEQIAACAEGGARHIRVRGVLGQRYLGTSLQREVRLSVEGIPGQDLGAFMDGPEIEVFGHAQDGCGNTMNAGSIVIHGSAGDVVGLSMRGGRILVRDNVGYRVGYERVRGGQALSSSGRPALPRQYMAGMILGHLGGGGTPRYIGTGMHGGAIIRAGWTATISARSRRGGAVERNWLVQRAWIAGRSAWTPPRSSTGRSASSASATGGCTRRDPSPTPGRRPPSTPGSVREGSPSTRISRMSDESCKGVCFPVPLIRPSFVRFVMRAGCPNAA